MTTSRKYSQELRERAVRMVFAVREETGDRRGGVARVAGQLGINKETLRNWVNRAEVDDGRRPGVTTHDQRRIAELEREVRELRRANEILKAASAEMTSPVRAGTRARDSARGGDPEDGGQAGDGSTPRG